MPCKWLLRKSRFMLPFRLLMDVFSAFAAGAVFGVYQLASPYVFNPAVSE